MAITINRLTRVIDVPQADLILLEGTLYEFDVDAFLIPAWDFQGAEQSGGFGYWTTIGNVGLAFSSSTKKVKGSLTIAVVDSRTDELLVRGIGYGRSSWRDEEGLILSLVQKILRQAFGPRFKDWNREYKAKERWSKEFDPYGVDESLTPYQAHGF